MNAKYNKILKTTISLFISNGVKKTTMDDLANNANVSKVTIYKYFGDKDSLYHTVGKSILTEYLNEINQHGKCDTGINIVLALVMETLSDLIISNKLTLCKELAKLNDELDKEYKEFEDSYREIILQLISTGKNQGIVKQEINNEFIFYYIDMGLSYFENNMVYRNKMMNDDMFKAEFMEFLLSNIFL